MIPIRCSCGWSSKVPNTYTGKRGKCPQCKELIHVPIIFEEESRYHVYEGAHPAIPIALGTFIPGAGQIFNGQIAYGVCAFFVILFTYLLLLGPALIFHALSIIEAGFRCWMRREKKYI